jgi:hypothetical protein
MLKIVLALLSVAVAGCATSSGPAAGPKSPNQIRQQELTQMEKAGQRNDFDKPLQ